MSASCLVLAFSFSLPALSKACETFAACRLFAVLWTASDNFCEASVINCLAVSCSAVCTVSSRACSANCSCKRLLVLCSTVFVSSTSSFFSFLRLQVMLVCAHFPVCANIIIKTGSCTIQPSHWHGDAILNRESWSHFLCVDTAGSNLTQYN